LPVFNANRKAFEEKWEKMENLIKKFPSSAQQIKHRDFSMRRNFTLLELAVVFSIIMLIVGLTLPRLGKLPSGVSLRSNVDKVRKLFLAGQLRAVATGKEQSIRYAGNAFALQGSAGGEALQLPQSVRVVFPAASSGDDDAVMFQVLPGGEVRGPGRIIFAMEKHAWAMTFSALTGDIAIAEQDPDKQ
jgi:type II secretory pathway pseudopilin PulG